MAKKRPYSYQFTARRNPRRYLLSGIPPTLWEDAKARARREHIALRTVILQLVKDWTYRPLDSELRHGGVDAEGPEQPQDQDQHDDHP